MQVQLRIPIPEILTHVDMRQKMAKMGKMAKTLRDLDRSAEENYGKARVEAVNEYVEELREFSPEFAKQLDDWFGKGANIGFRMVNWYFY